MTSNGWLQIAFFIFILLIFVKPLGTYIANVYQGHPTFLSRWLSPFEILLYRVCNINSQIEMNWKQYLRAILVLNLIGVITVYLFQRFQWYLPYNPESLANLSPDLAFNTAASFVTNTDWQAYRGESTLSYLTQCSALTVQNFLSAATGMAVLMAFIRGLARHATEDLGNFWVDLVRGILYILLPLSFIFALLLNAQGVIQNFKPYEKMTPLETQQTTVKIPMGPVASQVAIKQLGSNGGGFFNTSSAHPFENPTPLSNFLELIAIVLIPAALCYTFGILVKDKRQGWAIFIAMLLILIPILVADVLIESRNITSMEGKETRIGVVNSAMWSVATTATSNGSTNAMLDSFTPLGGLIPLWLMQLGEIVFGGLGSGLYGMIIYIILTVFIAGLMVGRTPEYLGKKIEPFEMKMTLLVVLLMPITVLILTSIAVVTSVAPNSIGNTGSHGFTEILYAITSMGNNNGSSFDGINANLPFYNIAGGLEMLIMRFGVMIAVLALAGSFVRKKVIPQTLGTLCTFSPLFIILLIAVIMMLGALTFFPALLLGPIVEHLMH